MNPFEEYIARNWKRYIFGFAITALCVGVSILIASSLSDVNHDWSRMVTIATYGDGEKIEVRESVLWIAVFLLWTLFTSFGRHGSRRGSCNCKCGQDD